jgi:hypothetical protein
MRDRTSENETLTATTKVDSKPAALPREYEPRFESDKEFSAFINQAELLRRLKICRKTAYLWECQSKLPVVKINHTKRYHWPSVEAALLRMQRGGDL